ncbi:MAG: hypothetical protein IJQ21_08985 [Lachnospiraceae bacterium]|nr:hypothetical protein [Lachnospiraceae bacterium]
MKPEDTKIYEILCDDNICGEAEGEDFYVVNEQIAPLYLTRGGSFRSWVEHRSLSDSRGLTARNLKSASGIATNASMFETAMRFHAAMVTDHYWVREKGEQITREQVSFDRYDGFFYRLSLGLDSSHDAYRSDRGNPELTNIGNSDKAWLTEPDGRRYLYKRQPLHECFQEVAASRIAQALGIPTVVYELMEATPPDPEFGRTGIIRSADFTWKQFVNLEHADALLLERGISERDIDKNAGVFAEFGLEKQYLDLKYFDYLTGNPDRHVYNYGILRDCRSGEVRSMAPNYDNNFAFTAELDSAALVAASGKYGWEPPSVSAKALEEVATRLHGIADFSNYKIDALTERVFKRAASFHEKL